MELEGDLKVGITGSGETRWVSKNGDGRFDGMTDGENRDEEDLAMAPENRSREPKRLISSRTDIGDAVSWKHKKSSEMTERDWRIFREDHDIIIKGGRVPNPMRNWDEAVLPQNLIDTIKKIGYKYPTPIQIQALPIGLERRDLIGIAPTGSGKSCAFLLPLIAFLQALPLLDEETCKDGPYALILAPTRELAVQIDNEFQKFAKGTGLRSTVVVGGRSSEDQAFLLRKGSEVMIGTPGRIEAVLKDKYTVLNHCFWVIIDEADKMLELGPEAESQVNYIMESLPNSYQKAEDEKEVEEQVKSAKEEGRIVRVTHMFSATMPSSVERLARKHLRYPAYISIGEPGGGKKEIEQKVEMMSEGQKKQRLLNLLNRSEPPIIIFANQKREVEVLAKVLEKEQWKCVVYHGGKTQEQREAAVQGFKQRKYDILVATDLAGRGLDVEGVKQVINFDAPKNIQDYTHRIGRTGRAGKKGLATTFLTSADEELFFDLKNFLMQNNQNVPQELAMHPATKIKPGSVADSVPRRKQVLYVQQQQSLRITYSLFHRINEDLIKTTLVVISKIILFSSYQKRLDVNVSQNYAIVICYIYRLLLNLSLIHI
eukprot:TRINITY_DN1715_c0_g1_i4.p1 TRINITY_DN1715_c0_g1~~TRINITY_DN1715_c0_g1_i4.p1  ORF type:complete len:599 (+),score=59.27 TRINITY_DN1715_c0_g1_i4:301-2097(+)